MRQLRIEIGKPVPSKEGLSWICEAKWSGVREGAVSIYGATSFQALRLALDHVEVEVPASLPGWRFSENGMIWPTPMVRE